MALGTPKGNQNPQIKNLENALAQEQSKISQITFDIGTKYVEQHELDYDPVFGSHFSAIADAKNNIEQIKEQILLVKGLVVCTNCASEIPAQMAFCPNCGTKNVKQPAAQPPVQNAGQVCPNCGAPVSPGAVFCAECGTRVSA